MRKWMIAICIALFAAMICAGCSHRNVSNTSHVEKAHKHDHEHGHHAAHGGCLNAIVTCENGHAEVKLDGDKLQMWLVGGGSDTDKSVRVPDASVSLNVKTDDGVKELVLTAKPLELAGEKVGDCSHFEGKAPWLNDLDKFTADGQITLKGKKMPLRIEYPDGYDPD